MNLQDFYHDLHAIWLVFADSCYLNNNNAPKVTPDQREKSLVDLFRSYLSTELASAGTKQLYDECTIKQLTNILNLLELWSKDLEIIYQIRNCDHSESQVWHLAQRFLQRVRTFENCTVIPNGLISARHTDNHENINLAILKQRNDRIDWIQVNPGGLYHQRCTGVEGEKCTAYFEIAEIESHNITEDWLYLLVGLKAVSPSDEFLYYKEKSLYECLLAHLNGKTTLKPYLDDSFALFCHTSPVHTWQVIDQSFRYLVQHFLGEAYHVVYWRLLIGFKLFLIEKTFAAYQNQDNKQMQQCHYLLQEMCRHIAQQVIDHINEEQITVSLTLIDSIKLSMSIRYDEQNRLISSTFQLNEPNILSLCFVAPNLVSHAYSPSDFSVPHFQIDPVFLKPGINDDIIDYLKHFKCDFIDKLVNSALLKNVALLSYGIEEFLIEYVIKTSILEKSAFPFSKDDIYLAETLMELAEIYYGCQGKLVKDFLSNTAYQPQFYAKNLTVQFFVYAAVAALNLRDKTIGPLLSAYNFSTACSKYFSLSKIIPHLVISDSRYLKALFAIQAFFTPVENKKELFSYENFRGNQFSIYVTNNANEEIIEVAFAYKLLQKYYLAFEKFTTLYKSLEDEKLNEKWHALTYTNEHLPKLYCILLKMAFFSRASLTNFYYSKIRSHWYCKDYNYWDSRVHFQFNRYTVKIIDSTELMGYTLKPSDLYQRFIIQNSSIQQVNDTHFSENEIIASQDKKPPSMDFLRYMHLGFLQSEPWLKLERLYIAIKDQTLDFNCAQECILIKQTLFEVSVVKEKFCSLLEFSVESNPYLIHKLGLLCVEKALAMKYRLTQHSAICEILEVLLGLLTFYPAEFKNEFIENIINIYYFLKAILDQPPTHLSDSTLLHLNAYLIISVQAKLQLIEKEALTILKALLFINNYKVKGFSLDNNMLLLMHMSCYTWSTLIEHKLSQYLILLNDLMLVVLPQWDQASVWQKSQTGLFICGDYAIKPMLGVIYFKNQPITGLPDTFTTHGIFKEYLVKVSFVVIPGSREINGHEVACYTSVNHEPQIRLTLVKETLLIEEWIDENYQLYLSPRDLSDHAKYPCLFFQLPHGEMLRHWLDNNNLILIKNQQRHIIYRWDLQKNTVYSLRHQGYVIPWEQLEDSYLKTRLAHIETPDWIEIIASQSLDSSGIAIQSVHFSRLGLDFDYHVGEGTFVSRQIHGYYLAKQKSLNIFEGFCNYFILENQNKSKIRLIKVVVPHREIRPVGSFYTKITVANLATVKSPSYFVYDLDQMTGLLKANNIGAQLYLALIYYCSASLDDNDISHCNAYHLARENLEICWKDQPYDEIELSIMKQLISQETKRDCHSHRIALYLKIVSLISSSLCFAFLYTGQAAEENRKHNKLLLEQSCENLAHIFMLYLQNKPTIFARIKLSVEEEKEILKHCHTSFESYYQLYFQNQPEVSLSKHSKNIYKKHYQQLFAKGALRGTSFSDLFRSHIEYFSFSYDTKGLNFSKGIKSILIDRFRLVHFITLYKFAQSSLIKLTKYCYLLHHTVLRSTNDRFPFVLCMMLARALLLVAENPGQFPEAPRWFDSIDVSVELFKRSLTETKIIDALPDFYWDRKRTYDSRKWETAEKEARKKDEKENECIWSCLHQYDLNSQGIPLSLPDNARNFTLQYESYIDFTEVSKRDIVRKLYLQAAYNDAMHQFFVNVLKVCDQLKYNSAMGLNISPFTENTVTVTTTADKLPKLPTQQVINLEKKAISQKPLVDLSQFFIIKQQPFESSEFLFEAEIRGPHNGYQQQFYSELKNSWLTYHNEEQLSYYWVDVQSIEQLETYLQTKLDEISEEANTMWNCIVEQFKQRPNSEFDHYFALRWYSGQAIHYHKGDLFTLLIEPHKIVCFNPSCLQKKDVIIQDLLYYVNQEINAAKIVRILSVIQQYKHVQNESEQFSLVQCIVKILQENLDVASYRYPHWLLFQLENNIIVRSNQQELIITMLNQTEKVMYQLNMGEGKSSVILPLLSCNLANGLQLLRINVLSSLLNTMKDFLCQRFSGLIRKRIYTLPFYRSTDISSENLTFILQILKTCQQDKHILLVTPEYRLCLQLKVRELMIENQQQIGAASIFNWHTYRQRAQCKVEVYQDLTKEQKEELLAKQDQRLKACLYNENYIDQNNRIIKMPPRGQGRKEFARFKEVINDPTLREWSCLKAAYRELLYNCKLAYVDSSEKLSLLNNINDLLAVDLLDESDEILKHGTELNYTVGDKYVFSGGELRWKIPQLFIKAIFCDSILRDMITAGKSNGFTVINLQHSSQGGVPFIQFFDESYYEKHIKPILLEHFFSEQLPAFRKYCINVDDPIVKGETSSLRHYVSGQLPSSIENNIVTFLADKGPLQDKLLIAKGWLSHGILFHAFNAKYRVQYGLAVDLQGQIEKKIAIPFWGKDMPSPHSEFSHPDVMLGFTIISYLYQGLNQKQLKETLLRLKVKFSSQVADAYLRNWTEASRAWIEPQIAQFPPLSLTSFQHLDLADEQCLSEVHKFLSGNYFAIFFYLNEFILEEEAMQYLYKISANAHSLVGYDAALGFSGTDDRKITMPFQIKSLRSVSEQGTNGKMLYVLTRDRNSHYYSLQVVDTTDLLKKLCNYIEEQPHCHALIDAGALVTGFTNYDVALFLMNKLPSTFLGILYFSDESNNLTVLTRDSKTVPLQDCYLDKQYLFAYLDDVHTRGTDIKLPLSCHAILTIGMGMQKDKLMQAAMRLRQLAKKQSVSLWGTHVVTLAIARDNQIDPSMINSLEVIHWVTHNTIKQINVDLFPVVIRKLNFEFLRKAETWLKDAPTTINALIKYCQEKELYILEEFYALSPQCEDLGNRLYWLLGAWIRDFWKDLEQELINKELTRTTFYTKLFNQSDKEDFRERLYTICRELAVYLQSAYVHHSLDNDEEKEVEVEIIQEQQVVVKRENRDAKLEKMWDVTIILQENFVMLAEQQGIIMLIKTIGYFVQLPVNLKNIIWHNDIYMTDNFINSVKEKANETLDNYLRPVDVVLIHRFRDKSIAVILSGHEASQIKSKCYQELNNNLLVHISDINGPTKLPIHNNLSKQEQKLLTIIKLFSGECQYASSKEVKRIAKRVGRIYPHYFTNSEVEIDDDCSQKLYGFLIEKGYLDFAGIMTQKLLMLFDQMKAGESPAIEVSENESHSQHVLKKLYGICNKLIIQSSYSLKDNHYTLWQWIGTCGRLKEYHGSELESVLNAEYQIRC